MGPTIAVLDVERRIEVVDVQKKDQAKTAESKK